MPTKKMELEAPEFDETDEDTIDGSGERERLRQSVVWATDWTTETILAQLERGNIELNPRFQRRDAWTLPRKSKFIESLVLGLPVPQIVLAEKHTHRGQYIVLDGKQRLLSLLQFQGRATESKHNSFTLSGLEILQRELGGRGFANIERDPLLSEYYNAFINQPIRALIIRNWPDELFLHVVFLRLNTGSVKLSSQELRQALFPGEFSNFADDSARASSALKKLLHLTEPDFRMRDVEILVRHLAFKHFLPEYRGEMKVFLDDACRRFNSEWVTRSTELNADVQQFEESIVALGKIFGEDNVAKRPVTSGRRPFNRAIFDVQVHYLTNPAVRAAAIKNKTRVKEAFTELWKRDDDFVRSVESTTKTIEATSKRFTAWGEVLQRVSGARLRIPRMSADQSKA